MGQVCDLDHGIVGAHGAQGFLEFLLAIHALNGL